MENLHSTTPNAIIGGFMLDLVKHPKVTNLNLAKQSALPLKKVKNLGEIIVNLNWNQNNRMRRSVDIDTAFDFDIGEFILKNGFCH